MRKDKNRKAVTWLYIPENTNISDGHRKDSEKALQKSSCKAEEKAGTPVPEVLAGELSFEDIRCSYASWRGCMEKKQARRTIHSMNRLFDRLFIENWQREEVPLYG